MKVTFNLPEDLVRELKFRAVREKRKLSEIAEEVFRRGGVGTRTRAYAEEAPPREAADRARPGGGKAFQFNWQALAGA